MASMENIPDTQRGMCMAAVTLICELATEQPVTLA